MGRFGRMLNRFERVLDLLERVLLERLPESPGDADIARRLAFRWDVQEGRGRLLAIEEPHLFDLDDLVGVDSAVTRLVANTEQFVSGHPANHVLLYGERGTGKSSAVKGLLRRFGERGLRLVEVHKQDLLHLPDVLETLRGSRHRFLLFCDDLSFDANDSDFRELKAALEGSLVAPPDNVRIIATSNRRHLLPETIADNRGAHLDEQGELHVGEAIDEKLALSDRFGLVIGFYPFDQPTYLAIVGHYARQRGLRSPADEIRREALRWALDRSSRSGRTAHQFVDDLAGREALKNQRGA